MKANYFHILSSLLGTSLGAHFLEKRLEGSSVEQKISFNNVIDGTTSHSTKPPKVGSKWLVIHCRRESRSLKAPCKAGQLPDFVRYAGCFSCWIPDCAGMTGLMKSFGLTKVN
jgi:hypothetical protein